MKAFRLFSILMISSLILTSCLVPKKKYDALVKDYDQCLQDRDKLRSDHSQLQQRTLGLEAAVEQLKNDTAMLGPQLRLTAQELDQLQKRYSDLQRSTEALKQGKEQEIRDILTELQLAQESLQQREDQLNLLARELEQKKTNLDKLTADMKEKESRLNELQSILDRKDAAVNALRRTVADALLGFEGKGLTINIKNGKVYVSMDETLLFETGKYDVSASGKQALGNLAKVLAENRDINVLIEGHTDNVPLRGVGQIKDNWDLSVMRATSVVKILTSNAKVDPRRLTAAGRSEYVPVDKANTTQARSKNRRTEIILTPKLDELFQILETQ